MAAQAAIKTKTIVSEQAVEIDQTNVQNIGAKGVIDLQKGTIIITARLTTKSISGNPNTRQTVFSALNREMENVAVLALEELRTAGKDPNQPELFDDEE